MTTALWIIAVCKVIRMIQNIVPTVLMVTERKMRANANAEFINSLKVDDKVWVRNLLKEFEKENGNEVNRC